MTATRTGLGRRVEAINEMNEFPFALGNPNKSIAELHKGNVTNLAAPKAVHGFDVERFQDDDVKAVGQVMGQLEEPIPALVGV